MGMNIDSKEIQKIIDESNLKGGSWIRDRMKKLIEPKTVFVKDEIVEVSNNTEISWVVASFQGGCIGKYVANSKC